MDNKIYYSLPDFYNYYQLNMRLLTMMEQHPGWFRDNIVIDSMYGTFPGIIWNGGRTQFGSATFENMGTTIAELNRHGISVRFTFTNCKLTGRHFKDYYGNLALKIANDFCGQCFDKNNKPVINGVNINSEPFHDYIAANYPNLYLLWSTTKGLKTAEEVNELSKDTLTVIPYQMNNTDIIDQFTHPENLELLCCESCIDNCPDRQSHYDDLSSAQLLQPSKGFKCPHGCEVYYYYSNIPKRHHHISPELIEEQYLPRGINKFKLSGRNDNAVNVIERYVTYFPKPEYKDEVRNHLLLDQFFSSPGQSMN
jgi:hypothetical protein